MSQITAVLMARSVGVDPKTFRAALRRRKFAWHTHDDDWLVEEGGPEHAEMVKELRAIFARRSSHA